MDGSVPRFYGRKALTRGGDGGVLGVPTGSGTVAPRTSVGYGGGVNIEQWRAANLAAKAGVGDGGGTRLRPPPGEPAIAPESLMAGFDGEGGHRARNATTEAGGPLGRLAEELQAAWEADRVRGCEMF